MLTKDTYSFWLKPWEFKDSWGDLENNKGVISTMVMSPSGYRLRCAVSGLTRLPFS